MGTVSKVCCVIGCGKVPANRQGYLERRLGREISEALEGGFKTFIAEYSEGVGLLFARCVNEQRVDYPKIFLEFVIPQDCEQLDNEVLAGCNGIKHLCDECQRNYPESVTQYLVEQSDRVIVVCGKQVDCDNIYAMGYARTMGRDLQVIQI